MPITILIAEANPIERVGLRTVLHRASGVRVLAEAESPAAVIKLTDEHRPEVIILGEELLKMVGHVLLEELRRRPSPPAVLVLGQEESTGAVERLLSAGAAGFVPRSAPVEELIHAIQRAAAGDPAVSVHLLGRILRRRHHPGTHEPPADPTALLSQRELEILRLTGLGMEAKEVAEQLKLSPGRWTCIGPTSGASWGFRECTTSCGTRCGGLSTGRRIRSVSGLPGRRVRCCWWRTMRWTS
ncbi:MAG: response regulator transcription factor [Verrucomicrobia bacterium]|nr:response regulator transcription factor [Verrucomicrobiota bacterium]